MMAKRFLETVIVVLTFPLWIAVLGVAAVAVFATMGRPVLFRQERAGLGGKIFRILKLRTMRPGEGDDRQRLTRTGRFLRRTSLDELPQLFHVLSGKMALVGPRPLPARYLPRFTPEENRRHEVRPGITGWAQVNGRNAIDWDRKLALDLWYVQHRSLALDLKIIALTIVRAFAGSGIDAADGAPTGEFRPDLVNKRVKAVL